MKTENAAATSNSRDQVIEFLLFLASAEYQQAASRLVPPAVLAYELCRLWFNVIYAPGRRYIDSLKGDFSPEKARQFRECFSEAEFAALERFHRFFELRIDMLPEGCRRSGEFPEGDSWENVRRHARYLAEELEPDAEKRRSRLAKYLRKALTNQERLPERADWNDGPALAERSKDL